MNPSPAAEASHQLDLLARLLRESQRVLLFTGAGASTESGIPDYRTPGGPWSRHRDVKLPEFLADADARAAFWARGRELYPAMLIARPNAVHHLAVRLHNEGRLTGVITQNVDGLHGAAGLPARLLVELHGNAHTVACLSCGAKSSRLEIQRRLEEGEQAPPCLLCGGILKSTTVIFGQPLPPEKVEQAREMAGRCDLCLVIGSSLKVYPAGYVPHWARKAGAELAIINLESTRLDGLCRVAVHARAAATLDRMLHYNGAHHTSAAMSGVGR